MTMSFIVLIAAVLLSIVYTILGCVAYTHVDKRKTAALTPPLLALTLWWPFYDIYDEAAWKVCIYGRVILPITIAVYVIWVIQR